MNKIIHKYRFFAVLLFPLYVNFLLLAPFMHYHSSEDGLQQSIKVDIHSHIIGHDNHEHHSEHHLDDCNDHQHLYEPHTFQFTKLTKTVNFDSINKISSFLEYLKNPSYYLLKLKQPLDLPAKILWEKFVHNSTNTSPPTA